MKILVISDSHHARASLDAMPEFCRVEQIGRILHLGDHIDDAEELEYSCCVPTSRVPGNCDHFFFGRHDEVWETIGHREYLLVHGHQYDVKRGTRYLADYARQIGVAGAFFGHTHEPYLKNEDGLLLLNPGSLRDGSLCVLDVEGDTVTPRFVDLYEWLKGGSDHASS